MKFVTPRVYLIGETQLISDQIIAWLESIGGGKILKSIQGTDGEKLIELAGRRCYNSYVAGLNPNVTKVREDSEKYHGNIISSGHFSTHEHFTLNFALENVSRVFTHELVRHRTGVAISQESLRFVRIRDIPFWYPNFLIEYDSEKSSKAREIIEKTLKVIEENYHQLEELYDIDHIEDFTTKKKLTSAFRRILPDGMSTGLVWSVNFRELRHIIKTRTSKHAEEEIDLVFDGIYDLVKEKYPMLLQDVERDEDDEIIFQ